MGKEIPFLGAKKSQKGRNGEGRGASKRFSLVGRPSQAVKIQQYVEPDERIFGLTYQGARAVVNKAGKLVGIHLRSHDLRRHAATNALRSGTPLEIVSKVILRHANLSTTQTYLGKVSETEALRWTENVYA